MLNVLLKKTVFVCVVLMIIPSYQITANEALVNNGDSIIEAQASSSVEILDSINIDDSADVVADSIVAVDSMFVIADTTANPLTSEKKNYSYLTAKRDFYKILYAGVPMVMTGLVAGLTDNNIRSFRNEYATRYNYKYDDYIQYSPAAAMLLMKSLGVPSRSSWSRMLVSDAFAVALMAGTTNLIKETTLKLRPDGSNRRSFPSGHTATAFLCATMLHKEYGHISPWISIGGYAVATTTGISRILNNKHWVSDVLVGGGIGILSAEIGYFLADLIFKDKGINHFELPQKYGRWHNPSFVGLYLGYSFSGTKYTSPENAEVSMGMGVSAGLEGAYFFNPYIGVGGRFALTHLPIEINGEVFSKDMEMNNGGIGLYFSYPFSSLIHVSAKVIGGFNHFSKCNISDERYYGGNTSGLFSTGGALVFMTSKAFNMRIFCDYNVMGSVETYIKDSKHPFHAVTVGGTLGLNF